ncbi:MAG TPA: hypothetical protein VH740_16665 [Vicinamibacterales bacterium]
MRKAAWGVLAGVIGSAVGAALLTRWSRRLAPGPIAWDPLVTESDTTAEYARMAEGIV